MSPSSEGSLKVCAGLLGVDPQHLNQALLSRVMQTSKGGLKGTVIMSVKQALNCPMLVSCDILECLLLVTVTSTHTVALRTLHVLINS